MPCHVTQRGNRQEVILRDEEDSDAYLGLLAAASRNHGLEILAYCLMPNHVHAVAVPRERTSLAKAFRFLNHSYALFFNKKYSLCGHVWQDRFYSSVLDESHMWNAIRYVERNPVRAKICSGADQYPFSSAYARINGKDDILLSTIHPWGRLTTMRKWNLWLGGSATAEEELLRKHTYQNKPIGDPEFIARLEIEAGMDLSYRRWGQRPKT